MSAVLDSRGTACAAILATVLAHISRSGESPDDDRPELALRALRRGDSSGALTALWDCVAGWPVGVVDDTGNIGYCGRERSKLAPLCRALAEWIEGDDDAAYARDVAADSLAPYIGTRDAAHHAIGVGHGVEKALRRRGRRQRRQVGAIAAPVQQLRPGRLTGQGHGQLATATAVAVAGEVVAQRHRPAVDGARQRVVGRQGR